MILVTVYEIVYNYFFVSKDIYASHPGTTTKMNGQRMPHICYVYNVFLKNYV